MLYMVQVTQFNGYECYGIESFHPTLTKVLLRKKELIDNSDSDWKRVSYEHAILEIDQNGDMTYVYSK